jgi:hypothetical protein
MVFIGDDHTNQAASAAVMHRHTRPWVRGQGYCLRADIVVDQAELYGLIDRVANLGRELLEVRRVDEKPAQASS